jgi:hypothetical protein
VVDWFLENQPKFRETKPGGPLWNRVLENLHAVLEYWQQWEVFCCWHEIIRAFLFFLDEEPKRSGPSDRVLVPLREFFPTPLCHASLDDLSIDITNAPKTNFARANHRWPESKPFEGNRPIAIRDGAHVVLNSEGAVCDWFSRRKIAPRKINGKLIKKINLCGQAKHSKKPNKAKVPLGLAVIQKERRKIDDFQGVTLEDDTLNVLCIVTNRPIADDVTKDALPPHTLVIHPGVHRAYFGAFQPGALDEIAANLRTSPSASSSSAH